MVWLSRGIALALSTALIALPACKDKDSKSKQKSAKPVKKTPPPKIGPPAPLSATATDPEHKDRIAAAQIVISFKGMKFLGRGEKPTRSKGEAKKLAESILAKAKKAPDKFGDLARQYSEDHIGADGGQLSSWHKSANKWVTDEVSKLEIGEISGVIDTRFGWTIYKRTEPVKRLWISARGLLVAYKGARRAAKSVTRSNEEALARVKELAAKGPGGFEALIKAESDGWNRATGGFFGNWIAETSAIPALWERAIFKVEIGELTAPVPTPFGWMVFKRETPKPTARQLAGAHILISHKEVEKPRSSRTKEEARKLAAKVALECKADPMKFAPLARKHSDDSTKKRGGDLGAWKPGTRLPENLDAAYAALAVDEVGGPLETAFGFHIIKRYKSPETTAVGYYAPYSAAALSKGDRKNPETDDGSKTADDRKKDGKKGDKKDGKNHDGHGH